MATPILTRAWQPALTVKTAPTAGIETGRIERLAGAYKTSSEALAVAISAMHARPDAVAATAIAAAS